MDSPPPPSRLVTRVVVWCEVIDVVDCVGVGLGLVIFGLCLDLIEVRPRV